MSTPVQTPKPNRDQLKEVTAEKNNWRWIGEREGIHRPDLDEDISVENLIFGQPSGESQDSFRRWLEKRTRS